MKAAARANIATLLLVVRSGGFAATRSGGILSEADCEPK